MYQGFAPSNCSYGYLIVGVPLKMYASFVKGPDSPKWSIGILSPYHLTFMNLNRSPTKPR